MKSYIKNTPRGEKKGSSPAPISIWKEVWKEAWIDVYIPKNLRGKIKIKFDKNTGQPIIKKIKKK